jgi:hypothetical protein
MDFAAGRSSNWNPYPEMPYCHEAPAFTDVASEVDFLLSFWRRYSEADLGQWKPLITMLVESKNKQRDRRANAADSGEVSDNIYVMH